MVPVTSSRLGIEYGRYKTGEIGALEPADIVVELLFLLHFNPRLGSEDVSITLLLSDET
jgi:hypothetical protein